MKTAGIDIGSLTAKALILDDSGIKSWKIILTGPDSRRTAEQVFEETIAEACMKPKDVGRIVATGYGRVMVPFADRTITEISCHAQGVRYLFPDVKTILDMGGQDCKAIRVADGGQVTNFVMNDRCAAGTGRYLELVAMVAGVSLDDIGKLSFETVTGGHRISSTCAVFAKTEILALLSRGAPKNDILAGACEAITNQVYALLRKIGVEPEFAISGGIAKNIGVVRRLEEKLGLEAKIPFEPQIVGALGAALFARDL